MNELTWQFSHASFGNMVENHVTHIAEIPANIPCVEELKAKLARDGYVYNPEYKLYAYRSVNNTNTEYYIHCRIGFDKSDGRLIYQVTSEYCSSVDEAVVEARATLSSCFYIGDLIEMGKGQLAKCKAIALRLANEHSLYLQESHVIVVSYESRGGRGGWKAKIADRRFSVNELRNPVAKTSIPAIMVIGNYYSDWRDQWLQKPEKVKIELAGDKAKMRYALLDPCIDGDLVVLNANRGPVFRFPLADWQRLLDKQSK